MQTVTLKNIQVKLHLALKEMAKQNHRSLNGEILACLQSYALGQRLSLETTLREARKIRAQVKQALSPEEIRQAIHGGRE